MQTLESIREITSHISFSLFGQDIYIISDEDKNFKNEKGEGMLYIQAFFNGEKGQERGVRHYISRNAIEDSIVKRCRKAIQDFVTYEMNRSFMFDDVILINPEVNFRKLIEISPHEVPRIENFDF